MFIVTQAFPVIRTPLNISAQLKALDLPAFEGRQHSGIDVSAILPHFYFFLFTTVELELTRLLREHRIPVT
jgi:hypothetical protein